MALRWLKSLYVWIVRRRHRKQSQRVKRRATYPSHSSTRTHTPQEGSRGTSPHPPPMISRDPSHLISTPRPAHWETFDAHEPAQRRTSRPVTVVRDSSPRRSRSATTSGAYGYGGYVTAPGQRHSHPAHQPQYYIYRPVNGTGTMQTYANPQYIVNDPYDPRVAIMASHGHFPQQQLQHPAMVSQPVQPVTSASVPPPPPRRPRTRTLPTPYASNPQRMRAAWARYEQFWLRYGNPMAVGSVLRFSDIPWPTVTPPKLPTSLTVSAVRSFLLSPYHSIGIPEVQRIYTARALWSPTGFNARFGAYYAPEDKEKIERTLNFLRGTLRLLYEEVTATDAQTQ